MIESNHERMLRIAKSKIVRHLKSTTLQDVILAAYWRNASTLTTGLATGKNYKQFKYLCKRTLLPLIKLIEDFTV